MFFHFSALQGGSEAFSIGMDVEFSVTREPKGERLNAVEYTFFHHPERPCIDGTSSLLTLLHCIQGLCC